MDSYLTEDARRIRALVQPPADQDVPIEPVFLIYAVLLRAKGEAVTAADVHDAWVASVETTGDRRHLLVPFEALDREQQLLDEPFASAIRMLAARTYSRVKSRTPHRLARSRSPKNPRR